MRWPCVRAVGRRLRGERGTTVTELLVAMSIMGVVMAALATLFVTGVNAEVNANVRFRAQAQTRSALDLFRRDVRSACNATVTSTSVVLMAPDTTQKTTYPCTVTKATWCTVASGSTFVLNRQAGSGSCTSSSFRRADKLVSGAIFSLTTATNVLPKIGIDLTTTATQGPTTKTYRLVAAIALRSAAR